MFADIARFHHVIYNPQPHPSDMTSIRSKALIPADAAVALRLHDERRRRGLPCTSLAAANRMCPAVLLFALASDLVVDLQCNQYNSQSTPGAPQDIFSSSVCVPGENPQVTAPDRLRGKERLESF